MASSASRTWEYDVFTSFHGPDVRTSLLSHFRKQLESAGITMFDDQKIVRGETIGPALTQAIRGSRISIVIFSKNYASSSWCLDELREILKCRADIEQIVITIFYKVDPSEVRKLTGKFGIAFNKTCSGKSEKDRRTWSKALMDASNIAGKHFQKWDNEAETIKTIAADVFNKLNATPSRDFGNLVGLEAHFREMYSLLHLQADEVKMVGIVGPAGIGKSTIARALYCDVSHCFPLPSFMENLRGSYESGIDEYGLKLRLQKKFLSTLLHYDLRVSHLNVVPERVGNHKVFIILDDVDDLKQLEATVKDITWFGPGSRIIVTTENKDLLQQHGINNIYDVGFPSNEEGLEILCRYAFRKSYPRDGFEELASRVTELCDNLPLGLCVLGSSLREKKEDAWREVIRRLETILDHRGIEDVLRVGYESLHEDEQSLFLHFALFANYKDCDLVKALFADNNLDINYGLKILKNKSLINVFANGEIVMHKLLRQVGIKAVRREEPWKRRILIDGSEICDVLEHAGGTRAISGISFDIFGIDELYVSKKAFKKMPNLQFLKVYKSRDDGNDIMHIPEEMEFPRRLKLLHWEAYPSKCLPPTCNFEYLVELDMRYSQLEYLWQGKKLLKNLKKMDLLASYHLKELPDLSNATNLEILDMSGCKSLVEIPPSFSHLDKLQKLLMADCINLQVIPADMNLASLKVVNMGGCSKLKSIPGVSTNIKELDILMTAVEDVPPSISHDGKFEGLTHLPRNVTDLDLSYSDIEKIPDCIKALHGLKKLRLSGCRRIAALPELPGSLEFLLAQDCESLEIIFCPLNTPKAELNFTNCLKLGQEARKAITQRSFHHQTALLPGREVPAEFHNRAKKSSLTIRQDSNSNSGFVVCVVISPRRNFSNCPQLLCRHRVNGDLVNSVESVIQGDISKCQTEHLFIFHSALLLMEPSGVSREIMLEFSSDSNVFDISECGTRIWSWTPAKRAMDQITEDADVDRRRHKIGKYGDLRNQRGEKECVSGLGRTDKKWLKAEKERRPSAQSGSFKSIVALFVLLISLSFAISLLIYNST